MAAGIRASPALSVLYHISPPKGTEGGHYCKVQQMDGETEAASMASLEVVRDPTGCGPRKVRKLALDDRQCRCQNAHQLQSLDSKVRSSERRPHLWERWRCLAQGAGVSTEGLHNLLPYTLLPPPQPPASLTPTGKSESKGTGIS